MEGRFPRRCRIDTRRCPSWMCGRSLRLGGACSLANGKEGLFTRHLRRSRCREPCLRAWRVQASSRRATGGRTLDSFGADRPPRSAGAADHRRDPPRDHRAVFPRNRAPETQRASAVDCHVGRHTHWCAARGLEAVSHALFARLARWRKERIGGVVYYLDCELAEGYAGLAPTQGPKALPRPDTMSRGTSTTH